MHLQKQHNPAKSKLKGEGWQLDKVGAFLVSERTVYMRIKVELIIGANYGSNSILKLPFY